MISKFLSASRWSASATDWASLILRLTLGVFMLTHGWPKLQQILSGQIQFADPLGIGVTPSLYLTVFAELICSALVVLGLWMRPALIPLIITMAVAAFIIHGSQPLGEKEHALLFLFPYIALFLLGSGRFSLDALIRKEDECIF